MQPVTEQSIHAGHHPHEATFHITVNGAAEIWHRRSMTYEEAVKLAFPNGPTGGDIRYSVSWTKPDGQEGALRPGHSVEVVEGMSFDVRNTDKS
jgi:hypothetical protein